MPPGMGSVVGQNFCVCLTTAWTLRLRGLERGKIFGFVLLQPVRSVCVSLSAFFIVNICPVPPTVGLTSKLQQFWLVTLLPWPLTFWPVNRVTGVLILPRPIFSFSRPSAPGGLRGCKNWPLHFLAGCHTSRLNQV